MECSQKNSECPPSNWNLRRTALEHPSQYPRSHPVDVRRVAAAARPAQPRRAEEPRTRQVLIAGHILVHA
jgi:hypothetical protein